MPSGIVISSKPVQFANKLSPISVIPSSKFIVFKLSQFPKTPVCAEKLWLFDIPFASFLGINASFKFLQSLNVQHPILVSVFGSSAYSIPEFTKASCSIVLRFFENVTFFKFTQLPKALWPIVVNVSGITIDSNPLHCAKS